MEEVMYRKTYQEYKAELDGELQRTAEGFVKIGYLLKVARDTNILAESGYKTVAEFAEAEYNLNKTQVSRFMSINDRFSQNGYSEVLEDQYKGFGYAKLTIMLQLPEEVNAELTPEFSKADIQAIKDEVDAEKRVSDIETMLEGQAPDSVNLGENTIVLDSALIKVLHQLFHDEVDVFRTIWKAPADIFGREFQKYLYETMAPAGEAVYSVRIIGMGRQMVFVKDLDQGVSITNVRTGEKGKYTWDDVEQAVDDMLDACTDDDADSCWERIYGESIAPRKTEIAPVQQKNETVTKKNETVSKKNEPRKESKVKKAPVSPAPAAAVEEEKSENATSEDEIPGQDNIMNHPEYLPEGMEPENITAQTEIVEELPIEKKVCREDLEVEMMTLWKAAQGDCAEVAAMFTHHTAFYALQEECTTDRLKEIYECAVHVAAGLEQMINVKKHLAESGE